MLNEVLNVRELKKRLKDTEKGLRYHRMMEIYLEWVLNELNRKLTANPEDKEAKDELNSWKNRKENNDMDLESHIKEYNEYLKQLYNEYSYNPRYKYCVHLYSFCDFSSLV